MKIEILGFFKNILNPDYIYRMDGVIKPRLEKRGYARTFTCYKSGIEKCRHDLYTKKAGDHTKIIIVDDLYSLISSAEFLGSKSSLVSDCPYKVRVEGTKKPKYKLPKKEGDMEFPHEAYEELYRITTYELIQMLKEDSPLI